MDADLAVLAAGAVTTLTPALPYLVKAGEAATTEFGKKILGSLWDRASGIWGLIRRKAAISPTLAEAITDIERTPADPDALTVLRVQLRKALEADPDFAARLQPLVTDESTSVSQTIAGDRNITAGRDLSGNTITVNERSSS